MDNDLGLARRTQADRFAGFMAQQTPPIATGTVRRYLQDTNAEITTDLVRFGDGSAIERFNIPSQIKESIIPDTRGLQRERYVEAATVRPDTEITRYFDFSGRPITNEQWNDLGEAAFRREVRPFDKSERVSETKEIETAWRGRDWKQSGPPDNWRTIVYEQGEHPRLTAFYVTESEAQEGHRQTVAIETGKAPVVKAAQSRDEDIRYGKSGRPYIPDLVGVYHQEEPRIEQRVELNPDGGSESRSYGIPAGDYNIIGALSPERDHIMDAAIAFRGVDLETHQAQYLTEGLDPERFLELSTANRISLEPGVLELVEGEQRELTQSKDQEQQPELALHL